MRAPRRCAKWLQRAAEHDATALRRHAWREIERVLVVRPPALARVWRGEVQDGTSSDGADADQEYDGRDIRGMTSHRSFPGRIRVQWATSARKLPESLPPEVASILLYFEHAFVST